MLYCNAIGSVNTIQTYITDQMLECIRFHFVNAAQKLGYQRFNQSYHEFLLHSMGIIQKCNYPFHKELQSLKNLLLNNAFDSKLKKFSE